MVVRHLGNYKHNLRVMKTEGELIVAQRPYQPKLASDYLPCSSCFGFYLSSELWRHKRHCPAGKGNVKYNYGDHIRQSSLLMYKEEYTQELSNFFSRLMNDNLLDVIKSDSLLCTFANNLLCGKGEKHFVTVSYKCRSLAKLLSMIREKTKKETLNWSSVLSPKNVVVLLTSIKELCGYQYSTISKLEKPSLFKEILRSMKDLVLLNVSTALKNNNVRRSILSRRFLEILDVDIVPLQCAANNSLKSSFSGAPQDLPLISDIKLIDKYLKTKINNILNEFLVENFFVLVEHVMAIVIIFNRRRSGEVAKLKIVDWEEKYRYKDEARRDTNLTMVEKQLMESLELTYVLGKGRRYVPILFPPLAAKAIDFMNQKRKEAGVLESNDFVFPNKADGHKRGCDCIRSTAAAAGLQHPERISATNLRKFTATALQVCYYLMLSHFTYTLKGFFNV